MGVFKKGPLQSPRQAKKSFDRIVKEEVDDKRAKEEVADKRAKDDLAARRQQKKGGK